MVNNQRRTTGTPKARSFGAAVREAREAREREVREDREQRDGRRWTLRAVAGQLGIDPSRLSKIETGKAVPSADVAERILDHLGVTGDHKAEVMALLQGAETEAPWYANTLPEQRQHTSMIVEAEDVAREIVSYTIGVVPGLLQTKRYARAIMVGGGNPLPASEVTIRVMTRMGRQGVLAEEREHPVHLVALIHETALRQRIGGVDVMIEQLEFLLKMMRRSNVDVRIVPDALDWHEGLEGSFSLISPREDADLYPLVFLEPVFDAVCGYGSGLC
ncbi:helix-turn-helix domain-containing protein [Amycolatopsis vancoresmycina]|nr:helix-turn-helix transcriptional regulator [Amycolatopsis vancoresmycina]